VVLAAFERKSEIAVEIGPGKRLTLKRSGAMVHASDGRRAPRIIVSPTIASLGLGLGERVYPGTLAFEPHANGGLRVTNLAPLEPYVEGVVAAELVLWSALPAELEAQAIMARTVVLATLEVRPFVWDTTADQAYLGRFLPGNSPGARRVAARLSDSVAITRGIVIARERGTFDARFHAACAGTTAVLRDVFPESADYATGVACATCRERLAFERGLGGPDPERPLGWTFTATAADLARVARALGVGTRVTRLTPHRVDSAGRWIEVRVTGNVKSAVVSYNDFRLRIGATQLRSSLILRTWPKPGDSIDNGLFFEGVGRGHGVGLCQEGSHDYAELGWEANRILAHYYPGTRVTTTIASATTRL
jgi:stage II sporulation protein D